jgi:hypothetical protein
MDISAELAYGLEMKQLENSKQFHTARASHFPFSLLTVNNSEICPVSRRFVGCKLFRHDALNSQEILSVGSNSVPICSTLGPRK